MDYFDCINRYFGIFSADAVLTGLLGTNPSDVGGCDQRIRRSFADTTVIDPAELPFFDYGFLSGGGGNSGNYKLNKEPVEFNIYCTGFYEAELIYKEIHRLLNENYEDAQISAGSQRSTVTGVYCWSFRVKTMVSS